MFAPKSASKDAQMMTTTKRARRGEHMALFTIPMLLFVALRFVGQRSKDLALFDEVWQDQPNISAVQLLISEGANVGFRDGSGLTPLHGAANASICKMLLDKGADVN